MKVVKCSDCKQFFVWNRRKKRYERLHPCWVRYMKGISCDECPRIDLCLNPDLFKIPQFLIER